MNAIDFIKGHWYVSCGVEVGRGDGHGIDQAKIYPGAHKSVIAGPFSKKQDARNWASAWWRQKNYSGPEPYVWYSRS